MFKGIRTRVNLLSMIVRFSKIMDIYLSQRVNNVFWPVQNANERRLQLSFIYHKSFGFVDFI